MHRNLLLVLLIFTLPILAKLNVAVYDLKGTGMTADQMEIFSDRLRAELTVTKAFKIMERGEMDAILREMELQQSGMCSEQSCLVEVGQLLAVDRVITGTIGHLAYNYYSITLRILNVETGEILNATAYEHSGDIRSLLSVGIKQSVQGLARAMGLNIQNPELIGKTGDLYIKCDYDSSTIEIDGVVMAYKTPVLLRGYPAGRHRIILRNGNLYGAQNINLPSNDLTNVTIPMRTGNGGLIVYSEPLGASAFLNNRNIGTTPIKRPTIKAGSYTIRLEKDGFLTSESEIAINIDENIIFEDTLEQLSYLSVSGLSSAEKYQVLINGREVRRDNGLYPVTAGRKEVTIQTEMNEPWKDTLNFSAGGTATTKPVLVPRFASIQINSQNKHVNIFINGSSVGRPNKTFNKVEPGAVAIRMEMENHDTFDTTFTVKAGKHYTIFETLQYSFGHIRINTDTITAKVFLNDQYEGTTPYQNSLVPAGENRFRLELDSIHSPVIRTFSINKGDILNFYEIFSYTDEYSSGIKKRKQNIRRIVFGSCAAVSLATGLIANKMMEDAENEYNDYQGNDQAQHNSNWNEVQKYKTIRNISYGTGGAFTLGFTLSIPF